MDGHQEILKGYGPSSKIYWTRMKCGLSLYTMHAVEITKNPYNRYKHAFYTRIMCVIVCPWIAGILQSRKKLVYQVKCTEQKCNANLILYLLHAGEITKTIGIMVELCDLHALNIEKWKRSFALLMNIFTWYTRSFSYFKTSGC